MKKVLGAVALLLVAVLAHASRVTVPVMDASSLLVKPAGFTATHLEVALPTVSGTPTLPSPSTSTHVAAQGEVGGGSDWSASFYFTRRDKHWAADAVALTKIHDFTKHGKVSGFEADAFLGTTLDKEGHAVAGVAVGYRHYFLDQLFGYVGLGGSITGGDKPSGGLVGSVGWKF